MSGNFPAPLGQDVMFQRQWLLGMGWDPRYIIDLPDGGARLNYDLLIADTREQKKELLPSCQPQALFAAPMRSQISLGEAVHQYLAHLQSCSKDEKRVMAHQQVLAPMCQHFGEFRLLDQIGLSEMKRFLSSAEFCLFANGKEKPPLVLAQSLRVYKHFWVWAYQKRYVRYLPIPRLSGLEIRFYTAS